MFSRFSRTAIASQPTNWTPTVVVCSIVFFLVAVAALDAFNS